MHPDRKRAVVAGVLSGLGIRPRRPCRPEDRLRAAVERADVTYVTSRQFQEMAEAETPVSPAIAQRLSSRRP